MNQAATGHVGSGSGGGKAKTENITFKKQCDKSSNTLITYCCKGTHFKKVELVIRKSSGDGTPKPYITLTMAQVIITDYKQSGSPGDNDVFEEEITINPRSMKFCYYQQKADGTVDGTPFPSSWDFAANVSTPEGDVEASQKP